MYWAGFFRETEREPIGDVCVERERERGGEKERGEILRNWFK